MEVKLTLLIMSLALIGCGSAEPQREVKPFTAPPPSQSPLSSNSSMDEKIAYIENSKASREEKDAAIAKVRAGQL